jgi:GNAT superfamily N-acetyltransferase
MFHRQTSGEFQAKAGAKNRSEMKALVDRRKAPGLLAYVDGEPAGWVSVGPRADFGRVERSPLSKHRDPAATSDGIWSITCFFIHRTHRGQGIASALVQSAVDFAASKGARVVEGYPFDPAHRTKWNSAEAYIGTSDMFSAVGFEEVERRKPGRPLMRYRVGT